MDKQIKKIKKELKKPAIDLGKLEIADKKRDSLVEKGKKMINKK